MIDFVKEIKRLESLEKKRQQNSLILIASENFAYEEVLKLSGSVLTNKYTEGYPGKRYYAGCKYIDEIEKIGIERVKNLFNCKFANIQPYSGSIANFSIYTALLNPGDVILSMDLFSGGHLTHSSKHSLVSKLYKVVCYEVDKVDASLDYQQITNLALEHKPKLIIAGSSSYPLQIDFKKFREIADLVDAYLLADICHLSGLIIAKEHPNVFPHAHIIMFTTHKQLRGPRGAVIAWNDEKLSSSINKAVFPGMQGGPQPNLMAAKAICLAKAELPEYKHYIRNVIKNAKVLANEFKNMGVKIVGNKTETHMLLLDTWNTFGLTGDIVEKWLEESNIIVNKNFIPNEQNSISKPSGIRIGTLATTAQGLKEDDFKTIANLIYKIISNKGDKKVINETKKIVSVMLKR